MYIHVGTAQTRLDYRYSWYIYILYMYTVIDILVSEDSILSFGQDLYTVWTFRVKILRQTCTHMYMYMYMYLKHEINVHVLSTIGMHYHQKMATIEADREVNTLRCTKQSKKATV